MAVQLSRRLILRTLLALPTLAALEVSGWPGGPAAAVAAELMATRAQPELRLTSDRLRRLLDIVRDEAAVPLARYRRYLESRHPLVWAEFQALGTARFDSSAARARAIDAFLARYPRPLAEATQVAGFSEAMLLDRLQGVMPPAWLRAYRGGRVAEPAPSTPPAPAELTLTLRPPYAFERGVPYEDDDGQNLIERDRIAGTVRLRTKTRLVMDTFGLTNAASVGTFFAVDDDFATARVAAQFDYSGIVNAISPIGEAWASVEGELSVLDGGTGAVIEQVVWTIRGVLSFVPSSLSLTSEFDSGAGAAAAVDLAVRRGGVYHVFMGFRATGQSFGGAEAIARVTAAVESFMVTLRA